MRPPRDSTPGPISWVIAVISLALPWAGLALFAAAAAVYSRGDAIWPWYAIGGAGLIALDVVIDFVWSHPQVSRSDMPDLNVRGRQLIGRAVPLVEAIEGGLGKLRCDDTLWQAEGPDLPAGRTVRIIGTRGMRLLVEPLD